ncbi:MAG: B12-binding domain-containing radical SAM protein [Candidatus Humimicrobiaceae bacterium]
MKIDIVVVYIQRYIRGHEIDFVASLTGIYLAALTPKPHEVRVIHQQVQKVDLETDADLVCLSFFSGFAPEAYRLSGEFRKRKKIVIGGGPHVTYCSKEASKFFDSIITGEAESVWGEMINDAKKLKLQKIYRGQPLSLAGRPTPRYDLLCSRFVIPHVIQATRGCPHHCSFCSVPFLNPGFRMRPVNEVIRDMQYNCFRHWWQRKILWFWDDNLTVDRKFIKELLERMIPLKRWWLSQASMDIADDTELLKLMKKSGCIGVFFGLESFDMQSLKEASKGQNKVADYKRKIRNLHRYGITVMAGFISGFDNDTTGSITAMAQRLYKIGVDVPFLSILTPFKGTAIYGRFEKEGRLNEDRGWEYYNGYNVTFRPEKMTPEELLTAHRKLWRKAFSFRYGFARIIRSLFYLRLGAFMMSSCMNIFYCLKAITGNVPLDISTLSRNDK